VASGATIPLDSAPVLSGGVTFQNGSDTLTVPNNGFYKIFYMVNAAAVGIGAVLAVNLSSSGIATGSNLAFPLTAGTVSGEILVSLTAGTAVSLVNNSLLLSITLAGGNVSAQLIVAQYGA